MSGTQQRQQVIDRRADLAEIALDVRERGCPDRDHDVVSLGCVGGALGELQTPGGGHALQQLLRTRLVERHPSSPDRVDHRSIVVDSQHANAAVGEGQRQRQPDAAESDDRDGSSGAHVNLNVVVD